MIEAVRFVRGAVAKKDYIAELTHFLIENGRITGFNGIMALSSPIDIDLNARPKATTFANALNKCEDTITMHMTKAGRLSIGSGKFRALVDCVDNDVALTPVVPEGWEIDVGPKFMDAIRATAKYQGVDASRPWAMGLLFTGQSVMATNNVVFVEYWHGHMMPFDMIIPTVAVNELLRINQDPVRVTATANSITFHFADDRWLRTQLVSTGWPEKATTLLDRGFDYKPVPPDLFEGLQAVKPFLDKDGRVHFLGDELSTSQVAEIGAHYQVDGLPKGHCYAFKVLELLEGATAIDFDPFPQPCGFLADGMRGMFLGMRIGVQA